MNHASGGAGSVERLRERIDESHVDLAALVWMLCIAGYLGTQVYGALRASWRAVAAEAGAVQAA